mmetsp:Transcript_5361/g.8303  ORF Transcript_5361/g.8303 Transcript_5361/m.8303 type:complete len:118 (+) Transcript_5361:1231-1584(+)
MGAVYSSCTWLEKNPQNEDEQVDCICGEAYHSYMFPSSYYATMHTSKCRRVRKVSMPLPIRKHSWEFSQLTQAKKVEHEHCDDCDGNCFDRCKEQIELDLWRKKSRQRYEMVSLLCS